MRAILVLLGTLCLFSGALCQGLAPPPDVQSQQTPYQRQLTVAQQTHILNDVQQHRFNLPNPSQQQNQQQQQFLIQQPSIEIQVNPTQQNIINQRPPPPPPTVQTQQANLIRFPQNNNYRTNNLPPPPPSPTILQHHTQTNFIPNFVQQQSSQTPTTNNQFQRSIQNQLNLPPTQQTLSTTQQSKLPLPSDQEFHAQNFITLRNHFAPQSLPLQQGQQYVQQQQQQQQQQQSQQQQQQSQQQQQQQQPQQQQQFSTVPQFSAAPQFSTAHFSTVPQFQSAPSPSQTPIQQFQSVLQQQPIQQQLPVFQPTPIPSVNPSQQFNIFPQQTLQQHQQQQQQLQQQQQSQQFQQVPPPQFQTTIQQNANPQYQNQQFNQFQQFPINNGQVQLTPEQDAKQKLIQKHEAFVQKQYEKQQNKVKHLHDEFVQKQQSIKDTGLNVRQPIYDRTSANNVKSRPVGVSDSQVFEYALRKYYEEHPTTTTTTTTTTTAATTKATEKPNRGNDPLERLLQAHRTDLYGQLQLESEKPLRSTKRTKERPKSTKALGRDELLKQLKLALAENPESGNDGTMDVVLPNGEKVQVVRTSDPNFLTGANSNRVQQLALPSSPHLSQQESNRNNALRIENGDILKQIAPDHKRDFVLPSGEKVEIIPAPAPPSLSGIKELPADLESLYRENFGGQNIGGQNIGGQNIGGQNFGVENFGGETQIISSDGPPSIEELTKRGLIPEGYEIVQQPAPGSKAAKTAAAPPPPPAPKKAPTFVYLEEQSDGSFKIQGVKANGENEAKTSGQEVESILERIKKGEIELPPSVTKIQLPGAEIRKEIPSNSPPPARSHQHQAPQQSAPQQPVRRLPPTTVRTTTTTRRTTTTTPRPPPPSTSPRLSYSHPYSTTTSSPYFTGGTPRVTFPSSTVSPYSTLSPLVSTRSSPNLLAASSTHGTTTVASIIHDRISSSEYTTPQPSATERLHRTTPKSKSPQEDLLQILKSNGLFAMAKYLRQSGLDGILNETGPYTVFAPTDKAFKNLLIQLGGPERAEEKFKANPRLLSGLLLHHVIPGSFEIASLQDEMTGVSLAGTQLRVNQYTMHDQEWNDVLITTINGAMVVNDKQDIKIPQGIAHGVDRVMFPLPVGDLLQTLQSDRENRFTNFLKILYASGLSEILQNKDFLPFDIGDVYYQGTKTYTVFAPTDKAFSSLEPTELDKLITDKEAAQAFAMRHVLPGTLFSAGMRFYQVKDSLLDGQSITLQKTTAGKIKVNDSQMITSNIPATNGVIHALDGLL